MSLVFPKQEYEQRHRRARELMKNEKLDALFITCEENYHYFTGGAMMSRHASNARSAIAILPADGDIMTVTHNVEARGLRLGTVVKDIRTYSSIYEVPNDLLVKTLEDGGLRNKRVGAEYGLEQRLGMPLGDFFKLTKSLPDVKFVDVSHIIWRLRMIKSKSELDYMRRACEITGRARQKCFQEVEPGMTEREVARLFRYLMLMEGADDVSFVHIATKPPSNSISQLPRELKVEKGDTLYLDGGAYLRTYTCDFPRLATVGKASPEQIRNHKVVTEINRKMMEAIKPGRTCADIYRVGHEELKKAGFGEHAAGRMGHGQGLMLTEPPSITSEDKTLLEPGLVFSTEPGLTLPYGIFLWEDVHVVTEDGYEKLSTETDELIQI